MPSQSLSICLRLKPKSWFWEWPQPNQDVHKLTTNTGCLYNGISPDTIGCKLSWHQLPCIQWNASESVTCMNIANQKAYDIQHTMKMTNQCLEQSLFTFIYLVGGAMHWIFIHKISGFSTRFTTSCKCSPKNICVPCKKTKQDWFMQCWAEFEESP